MIIYKKSFYFIISLFLQTALLHKELRVTRSGLVPASFCKIGLEFFTELNNTSDKEFHVELIPDECCLRGAGGEDCESLQVIGECSEFIDKESTKTLTMVAPLIDPFERVGYCTIHVDSRPADRRRSTIRDTLNIHFDTRIKENNTEDVIHCRHIDEDPLNDCRPVNCDTYYNGKKSYFDKHAKRCVEVPRCVYKRSNKPNQVYDQKNNKCVEEETINNEDIEFIKSLSGKERHPKDLLIIKTVNKPFELINYTERIDVQKSLINSNRTTMSKIKNKFLCQGMVQYFLTNRYTLLVLGLVVTVQCCLIVTMIYCLTKNSDCCNKKKVVRKFFNYRQDASVTTPLINTSNMDTETTEFEYISETSNLDKKIKCYKACQKDVQHVCKSMSDDVLLKCINRRDWSAKSRTEIIKENTESDIKRSYKDSEVVIENDIKDNACMCEDKQRSENSNIDSKQTVSSALSEREIKCHDYNLQSKVDYKALDHDNRNINPSVTTDKGAQACFSNDSIDDFLSERGMIFMGENASKYSFNSSSTQEKSSLTELTSKTSKNNIIKNVLSFLSKSKVGTASEPGARKSKSKNLELIHLSHASMYSSSSDLKNAKAIKMVKESRSTF